MHPALRSVAQFNLYRAVFDPEIVHQQLLKMK